MSRKTSSFKCKQHIGYKAIFKPRCQCLACWLYWLTSHPDEPVDNNELAQILYLLLQRHEAHENTENSLIYRIKNLEPDEDYLPW